MDNHDVCRKLRISPRTLQTLRDNGALAFSKIGNKTYYRPEDVERIIKIVEDRRKEAKWRGRIIWQSAMTELTTNNTKSVWTMKFEKKTMSG